MKHSIFARWRLRERERVAASLKGPFKGSCMNEWAPKIDEWTNWPPETIKPLVRSLSLSLFAFRLHQRSALFRLTVSILSQLIPLAGFELSSSVCVCASEWRLARPLAKSEQRQQSIPHSSMSKRVERYTKREQREMPPLVQRAFCESAPISVSSLTGLPVVGRQCRERDRGRERKSRDERESQLPPLFHSLWPNNSAAKRATNAKLSLSLSLWPALSLSLRKASPQRLSLARSLA